jgi:(R,R)-butanediol dehydrogenase/meso-butanediol dehydrogenase/diacetyl reductase
MKAAIFYSPHDLRIEEEEMPAIGDYEVLIKVKACGICGSDLHLYKFNWCPESVLRQTVSGKKIPGHEFSGEIVTVGSQVQGFTVGDRACGVGFGAMAEYVPVFVIPGMTLIKLPDVLSYEEGATLEPLADGLHIANLGHPVEGENAMIFGVGAIGLGVIQCLGALGVRLKNIIAVDVSDKPLDLAKQFGASVCINARKEDPLKKALEICGPAPLLYPPGMAAPPAVEIVYDCVGASKDRTGPPVIQQALDIVKEGGRIVCFGTFQSAVTVDFGPLIWKHPTIVGVLGFTPEEMAQALELMLTGKVKRKPVISHEFPLDQAKKAFETQLKASDSVKVLIKP